MSSKDDKSVIRPRIRQDRLYEFRAYFESYLEAYQPELVTTCITCLNFRENHGEICAKFNARPPARVIAYGCKDYFAPDEIPF